jgi:hypothetical protein
VLVVEKESVFKRLWEDGLCGSMGGVLLVTGKGTSVETQHHHISTSCHIMLGHITSPPRLPRYGYTGQREAPLAARRAGPGPLRHEPVS